MQTMLQIYTRMREYKIVYKMGNERRSISTVLNEVRKELIMNAIIKEHKIDMENISHTDVEIISVFRQ
jgi:hypothetical protein